MDREGRRPSRREWDSAYDDQLDEGYRTGTRTVERVLLHLVVIGLVGLVLVQTFRTNRDLTRVLVRLDGLEGVDWSSLAVLQRDPPTVPDRAVPAASRQRQPMLTVVLVTRRSEPDATLLIDGAPAGDFRNGSVTVAVDPGREIAVDGRAVQGRLRFRVIAAPGLVEPAWGKEVETQASRQVIGKARVGR